MHRYLFILIILLTSCHSKDADWGGKKVFRYNEANDITSLDPVFAKDQANIWADNQLFNGLVQMDDKLVVQPCIAKSWEITPDGLTYIFHLRNDVFFHDDPLFPNARGRRVKAQDFLYSLGRIIDNKVASPGLWIFSVVKGFKELAPAFKAINDSTFSIELEKPFPPFLGLLTMQYCSVVPKEVVEHYGKDFRNHPIGTGPFIFKYWKEGIGMVFHKNPNYFEFSEGKRLPFIDAVQISFITNRQTAFMQFVQGKLDFLNSLDASYKDELFTKKGELSEKYRDKFKMETLPYLNTEYLGILVDENLGNVKTNPLKNKLIRQAINLGFDRKKMMTFLRNNIGTPGISGMIPLGLPSFSLEKVKGYEYDPEKARQLLQNAGFPNGKGLPDITMSTTSGYLDICEYIQGQLGEIGIPIKIEVNQAGTHREMVAKQKLNFFRASWIADYPDAENYFSLFYSPNFAPGGPNSTHFKNKRFDELYENSKAEVDTSKRYEYYREMDRILIEEAPVVVLFYDKVLRLYHKNVEGIHGNAMNLLTLKRVKID